MSKLHPDLAIIGVDVPTHTEHCKKVYPFGIWIEADFESPLSFVPPVPLESAIVVNSDVIEHLVNPVPLLQSIRACLEQAPVAVLSTPERNLKNGWLHTGPPPNPYHTREWSIGELRRLVTEMGFGLVYAGLTVTHNRHPA